MEANWIPSPEERQRILDEAERQHREHEARERERLRLLKAEDHYTHCRDCGQFVKKSAWVNKSSRAAIERGQRPLCGPCWSEYEHEYY